MCPDNNCRIRRVTSGLDRRRREAASRGPTMAAAQDGLQVGVDSPSPHLMNGLQIGVDRRCPGPHVITRLSAFDLDIATAWGDTSCIVT